MTNKRDEERAAKRRLRQMHAAIANAIDDEARTWAEGHIPDKRLTLLAAAIVAYVREDRPVLEMPDWWNDDEPRRYA